MNRVKITIDGYTSDRVADVPALREFVRDFLSKQMGILRSEPRLEVTIEAEEEAPAPAVSEPLRVKEPVSDIDISGLSDEEETTDLLDGMNAGEAKDYINGIDDTSLLESIKAGEESRKNRSSVLKAIDARIEELKGE